MNDEDRQADKYTDAFFKQCVAEGRLTEAEYDELAVNRERSGCERPEWRYYPSRQDFEIYLNSNTWTQQEIADHLNTTRGEIRAALRRVYDAFPCLEPHDIPSGLPSLRNMVSIDTLSGRIDIDNVKHKF